MAVFNSNSQKVKLNYKSLSNEYENFIPYTKADAVIITDGDTPTFLDDKLSQIDALLGNGSGSIPATSLPTVPVNKGGTGATDAATARTNLGITPANIGAAASSHNHNASNINAGTLSSDRLPTVPITKGGTGATTASAALTNLGAQAKLTGTAGQMVGFDSTGKAVAQDLPSTLPEYSASNNGQFLMVVNGVPAWTAIPSAEEATF